MRIPIDPDCYHSIDASEVRFIVFPCTEYERTILIGELLETYGTRNVERRGMSYSAFVDMLSVESKYTTRKTLDMRVSLNVATVHGFHVMFVQPEATFCRFMVRAWLEENFSCKHRRDLFAITNPVNFHDCLNHLAYLIQGGK